MTNKIKILIITAISLLVIGVSFFSGYTSANDREVTLRNQTLAQQDVCKANFDKMFKVIKQVAQVPQEFMAQSQKAFKDIYPALMEGRYSGEKGNSLMKWVQESNPNFDLNAFKGLYEKLQVAIEANRDEYFLEQQKLIDLKREHSTFINTWWNKSVWGLDKRGEINIIIVTSATTKAAYATGEENDLKVFDKQ